MNKYFINLSIIILLNYFNFRLLWNIPVVALIYYTPRFITNNGVINYIPIDYYAMLTFVISVQEVSCLFQNYYAIRPK